MPHIMLILLLTGAILLGIGVNMWTVVLGHLVKSFPSSMRSEVIAGFGVQTTVIALVGKGIFPLFEYVLHNMVGLENVLFRYRIHMGTCTFFCFYGIIALFLDRKNVRGVENKMIDEQQLSTGSDSVVPVKKYQQKHSDFIDELEDTSNRQSSTLTLASSTSTNEIELAPSSASDGSKRPSFSSDIDLGGDSFTDNSCNTTSPIAFLNESQSIDGPTTSKVIMSEDGNKRANKQLLTAITLTFALLLQSIATTIMTVLWPLLAHDIFDLSAHTFGIITFVSSVFATGGVASFPVFERRIGGRVRCAAWGFGLGSILCILFCFCSFGNYLGGVEIDLVGPDGVQVDRSEARYLLDEQNETIQQIHSHKQLALHALSAIAFQGSLCFLEPSLKSILSLVAHTSSDSQSSKASPLGSIVGSMNSLGNVGGMIGNLAGTGLYKFSKSKDTTDLQYRFVKGGSLPFVLTASLMAICTVLIWRLDEPTQFDSSKEAIEYKALSDGDIESGSTAAGSTSDTNTNIESVEDSENARPDGCCLALRETTYDLKLD